MSSVRVFETKGALEVWIYRYLLCFVVSTKKHECAGWLNTKACPSYIDVYRLWWRVTKLSKCMIPVATWLFVPCKQPDGAAEGTTIQLHSQLWRRGSCFRPIYVRRNITDKGARDVGESDGAMLTCSYGRCKELIADCLIQGFRVPRSFSLAKSTVTNSTHDSARVVIKLRFARSEDTN